MKTAKYQGQKVRLNSEQREQILDIKKKYLKSLLKPLACLAIGTLLSLPQIMYKNKSTDIYNHLRHNHKLEYTLYNNSRDLYTQLSAMKKDDKGAKEFRIAKDNLEERTDNLITSLSAEDSSLKESAKEYILNPKTADGNYFSAMGMIFGFPLSFGSLLSLYFKSNSYFDNRYKFSYDVIENVNLEKDK